MRLNSGHDCKHILYPFGTALLENSSRFGGKNIHSIGFEIQSSLSSRAPKGNGFLKMAQRQLRGRQLKVRQLRVRQLRAGQLRAGHLSAGKLRARQLKA